MRYRCLSLEPLEQRTLLDSSGFSIAPFPLADPPAALVGSIEPTATSSVSAMPYTPPEGVKASVDGTTVRYEVVDPFTGLTVPGETVYDSSLSIVELINQDGIVAWTVGHPDADGIHTARVVGFAVYDTSLGAWKQAESGLAGVLSIAELNNRDGVVSWTIGFPNGDDTFTTRELGAATYDATLADWSQFTTRTSGGVRTIDQFQNRDRVVAWTLGHVDDSGGVTVKDIAFAEYDHGLSEWQRFQINGSTSRTVLDVINIDGTVAWSIGDPTDASGGAIARNTGFASYDDSRGEWQRRMTGETGERTVWDLTSSDGLVAWKIDPDGSGTRDVGAAIFDSRMGTWEFFETSNSSAISIVEFSLTDGLVAWSLNNPSLGASSAAQAVAFAAYDAGEHEWQQSQTPTSASVGVSDLKNDAGIVSWKQATADSSGDSFIDRSVGAATYDATRTTWTRFLSASDDDRNVVDMVNANRAVAWTITSTTGSIARDVSYVTYDVSLGRWRQDETSNGASVTIIELAAEGGNVAWRTDRDVFAVWYDLELQEWQSFETSITGDVELVDFLVDDGMIAFTIGYFDSDTGEYPARDVGAVIYDVALAEWKPLSVPFAPGMEVDSFAIEEFAIEFSVEGTGHTRGYDTTTQAWTDAATTPLASFSPSATLGSATTTVFFANTSMGADEWTWHFGDGHTATTRDATHVYDTTGTFTVRLDVVGPGGTDSTSTSVIVSGPATDLGRVTFVDLPDLSPAAGDLWYRLETSQAGYLTVLVDAASTPVDLMLFTENEVTLDASSERVEHKATGAGEVFFLKVSGSDSGVHLRIANQVEHVGTTVTVSGTDGPDTFGFDASASRVVTVNGVEYLFDDSEAESIHYDGAGGSDIMHAKGTDADEAIKVRQKPRFAVGPEIATIIGADFSVEATDVEEFNYDGVGGKDLIQVYDSPDDDTFVAGPGSGSLEADTLDYRVAVINTKVILGYAQEGGVDSAVMRDSDGNDKLRGTPVETRVKAMTGGAFNNRAKFFEEVAVHSVSVDDEDFAVFFDSGGDDVFRGTQGESSYEFDPTAAGVSTTSLTAFDFEDVLARSRRFGDAFDGAYLTGTDEADKFTGKSHKSWIQDRFAEHWLVTARWFEEVYGDAGTGFKDVANLFGTESDDVLAADDDWVRMATGDPLELLYEVVGFDLVRAYRSGGTDDTSLVDPSVDVVDYLKFWVDV